MNGVKKNSPQPAHRLIGKVKQTLDFTKSGLNSFPHWTLQRKYGGGVGRHDGRIFSGEGRGASARVDGQRVAGQARAGRGLLHGKLWRSRGCTSGFERRRGSAFRRAISLRWTAA